MGRTFLKMKVFKKKLFRKRTIIFTWAVSYIAILLLPIIISMVMYYRVEKVVIDEINRANDFYLIQVQQYMDGIADNIKSFSVEVAFNNRIQEIIPFKEPYTDGEYYKLYECVKELKNYKISNGAINDFFVYLKNGNTILNDKGNMENKYFFDVYSEMSSEYYEKWFSLVKGEYKGGQFVSVPQYNNSDKKKIYYIISFPSLNQNESSANFITSIDEAQLTKMSNGAESINKGQLMIINKDNKMISGFDEKEMPKWLNYQNLNKGRGMFEAEYKGEKVVISYISSQVEQCKYIHMMPKKVFWEKLEYARRIIYVSIFLCVFLGCGISIVLLRKNYAPMQSLLKELKGLPEQNLENEADEYQFIKKTIRKAVEDKEEYNQKLMDQKDVLKIRFVERLLKGNFGGITVNDSLATYDMAFHSSYFAVLLFYIEDFSEIFLEQSDFNSSEAIKMSQFVIHNVLEELCYDKFDLFTTESDGMFAAILNFKSEDIKESKVDLIKITEELQRFIQKHYRLNFTVAISNVHEKITGIKEAYEETLEAMEYKIVMGVEGVLLYDETKIKMNKEYYYPIEKEQQLINCIKAGNFESAELLIQEVFEKNFEDQNISPQIAKCLFLNLVSSILKTIYDLNTISPSDFTAELNRIQELIDCKNVSEVKTVMIETLKIFCEGINANRKNKNNFIQDKVDAYIVKNYKDENLSISAIADYFQMHPSYISKLYKIQAGDGILDSINKIRIEKSKVIMKEQKSNLEEVAKMIGYSNVRTFTRAFMKIEGITPGKFKELNQGV